ncbi:hypothetical protein D1007_44674 [Hordeum vulgare]|nr:hypothetical protein D1007_44674 [Hordeum vulgare]
MPGNVYKLKYPIFSKRKSKLEEEPRSASWFRDLACVNGVLKFIEMESHNDGPEKWKDKDTMYDSDLIMSLKRKAMDVNSKQLFFGDAWRAVTSSRKVSSNFWRHTSGADDVGDILVDGSTHSSLLSGLKGETITHLTFRDLYSAFPILSLDGEDIIYLKSLVEPNDRDGWVAAVDVGNKAVKAIGKYYLPDDFYYGRGYDPEHPFRACTLSRYLDITPGVEVSACRKITQSSSAANRPSITSIRVDELNSCEPRSKIQRQKIKRARNAAGSTIQNEQISQVHPVENNLRGSFCDGSPQELDNKVLELEREIEQERKQKKEQKPQQPCFNNWVAPCYRPGHSLWPHQNNLPPQQHFNKPDRPCVPGYASLAPVHGRPNNQPLWQQPPPSKQQLTSTSEFGPHEAPQPCFNNCNAASYHGYSQQLSAPNLSAYGTNTGYGNYQQHWQQLPLTLELPSSSEVKTVLKICVS